MRAIFWEASSAVISLLADIYCAAWMWPDQRHLCSLTPCSIDSLVQSHPKLPLHKRAFFWHSIQVPCTYLKQYMVKLLRKENLEDGGHWLLLLLLLLVMRSSWCSGRSGCTQILLIGGLISLIIDQISSRCNTLMGYAGIHEQLPRREQDCKKNCRN